MDLNPSLLRMVEKFQCPGCVSGMDTSCGSFMWNPREQRCVSQACGTSMGAPGVCVALGMPKGFDRPAITDDGSRLRSTINVVFWCAGERPDWNNLNVPVWRYEEDGYLFVRTFSPRIDWSKVDVIEGGDGNALCPQALDVSEFIDEI